jgi:nucleotidyltransferase/DNA polymerase involved in DNA repair
MRSRARYSRGVAAPKPLAIQERSWAIFTAFCYEARPLDEIGRAYQLSPHQVRRIVAEVEAQLGRARGGEAFLDLESAVEDLGLSVRTRNTLRSLGCNTVEDVLRLDLSSFVRGMGRKTKEELLNRLQHAGFHHPMLDEQPVSEIRILERSLERMQGRIDEALGAVAKEIRLVKQRLRKRVAARRGDKPGASPDAPVPAPANDYCGDEN